MKRDNPAKFSDVILDHIETSLKTYFGDSFEISLLDPFAGSCKIAKLKEHMNVNVTCVDIEDGWDKVATPDRFIVCDSEFFHSDTIFDCIVTSPTYGNRMADHHVARDGSKRNTYTHRYGAPLTKGSTAVMQFGEAYKDKHIRIFKNLRHCIIDYGLLIVNVSDFIRNGERVQVVSWWKDMLTNVGFEYFGELKVPTPRNRFGANADKRVDYENILLFTKI